MTMLLKRLAAASLAGGALAVSPIMLPAASAVDGQPPAECAEYESPATSSTTLTLDPSQPEAGDDFTAIADVLVAGVEATQGTVTFTFNGEAVEVPVEAGRAETVFTVPTSGGQFNVTASFEGICVLGTSADTAAEGSSDSAGFVAGVEGTDGGDDTNGGSTGGSSTGGTTGGTTSGSNRAGTSAGVNGVTGDTGSSTGSLGGTGVDTQTELYGLIGLGLVAVGGMSLMVHRRRIQA